LKEKLFERSYVEIRELADGRQAVVGSIYKLIEEDDCPDLSWLETIQDQDGNIISSCRYSNDDFKKYGKEKVQEWIDQDRERLESYGVGWYMVGVRAAAEIYIPFGDFFVVQTIESPGLWGIESDSGEDYFKETFKSELKILEEMLRKLNVAGVEVIQDIAA